LPARLSPLFVPGPAGKLEAVLHHDPGTPVERVAVVCHPHPLYGGTMHNKVAFRAAEALAEAGLPVLRFNFRGVNHSEGVYDGGVGERDDLRAALEWLAERFGPLPAVAAGFSFGAAVTLDVAPGAPSVRAMIAIAPPVKARDFPELLECPKPKAVVQGTADELCPHPFLDEAFPAWPEPKLRLDVPGATHFFDRRLGELTAAGRQALDWSIIHAW